MPEQVVINKTWGKIIAWIIFVILLLAFIQYYKELKAERDIFQNRVKAYCEMLNSMSDTIDKISADCGKVTSYSDNLLNCEEVSTINWD